MSATECILIDAAGTLLWKPDVIPTIRTVLQGEGIFVEVSVLADRHKLVSELLDAPDITGWDYYESFNTSLLRTLGIPATRRLASVIYESCRSLPWVLSPGSDALRRLTAQVGVLSNWDARLEGILEGLGMGWLDPVLTSTATGVRKPDESLFVRALETVGVPADRVLFLGDSVRLDIEPALGVGMRAALYDPHDLFRCAPVDRIKSLADVDSLLI